jgi:hypothetical protein
MRCLNRKTIIAYRIIVRSIPILIIKILPTVSPNLAKIVVPKTSPTKKEEPRNPI